MRLFRNGTIIMLLVFLVAGLAQAKPRQDDGVKRITKEELSALLKKGKKSKVVVVDVRDAGSFQAEHIKGAINIPFAELEKRFAEFPKNKLIVAYCS
jgi:3-mercaptopyruvate sulfurtransferase SseA